MEHRITGKIENLQRDMNAQFLHLTECMDDGFLKMSQRMDDKFEDVRKEFVAQNEQAEERQKSDQRFLLTTAIAAITVAATILGLKLNMN